MEQVAFLAFTIVLVALFCVLASAPRYIATKKFEKYQKRTAEREQRKEKERKRRWEEEDRRRYNQWLQGMPAKLSQGGFSSLGGNDRDELVLIYQLLMNGGDLNQSQNRLMEVALADPATSKFLELKGSQGTIPSPENSLSPQMTGAFSALGIAGAAGIMQRGQIRQELNEINENLADSGGDASSGGADVSGGEFFM